MVKERGKGPNEIPGTSHHALHYAWVVLSVGMFVVLGALGLARFGYSLVLPEMQRALTLDNSGAGILATVNLVGYLGLALVGGRWLPGTALGW